MRLAKDLVAEHRTWNEVKEDLPSHVGLLFLCRVENEIFVSPLCRDDHFGFYVDDIKSGVVHNVVDELEEMWLIER